MCPLVCLCILLQLNCPGVSEHFCLLILEGNVVHVLITLLLPFLIHLCEVDSLFWTRYLEKFLFCLGDPRTRFWKRLLSELSMCFMELWTCSCLDFPGSTTILDDFLKVSKKELLLPEFDLMVSNEKGVTELVA